jgi:hypothetical protein
MIKSFTRIWSYFFVIIVISLGIFILFKGQHDIGTNIFPLTMARFFIMALFWVFPTWLLTRFKTITLDDNGLKIKVPFQFKSNYYYFSDFEYYETCEGIARGFSLQEMKIVLKTKKKIIITSMANTKFKEIDAFLSQKITKH